MLPWNWISTPTSPAQVIVIVEPGTAVKTPDPSLVSLLKIVKVDAAAVPPPPPPAAEVVLFVPSGHSIYVPTSNFTLPLRMWMPVEEVNA